MINLALCGIGRAGIELIRTVRETDNYKIVAAFCKNNSEKRGKDIGLLAQMSESGIYATEISEADRVLSETKVDVVIDFSNPAASMMLLNACKNHGTPAVICTTGFSDEDIDWMIKLAWSHKLGIVYAPNVTLGINVLMSLLKTVARALPFFDYQITEIHHNKKHDIPSGTAKRIAESLERDLPLSSCSVPINSVRAGGYIGIHEVVAAGECERISISHESFSRRAFASGALVAAEYIKDKKGWHYMEDVLDIGAMLNEESDEKPRFVRA
jgi:4-hydroxy-tetrahydrodipicolinate reductase